jgi:cytochrome P450
MPAVLHDPAAFFGPAALQDPYSVYDRMRTDGGVHRMGDSEFYAVASWDAVLDVSARVDDFSSNLTATMVYHDDGSITPFSMGPLDDPSHTLATADGAVHAAHRKLLVPHLAAKRLRQLESFVADTVDRLWSEHVHDGHVEWMSAIANRLPMMVVCRQIGVPDEDADQLAQWAYTTTTLLDGVVSADQLDAASAAMMALAGYVIKHFAEGPTQSTPTLLNDLAARCAGGELDQLPAVAMMLTLFGAGGESTASLLGSAAWILATQPDIQRRLRDNPELLSAFVDEVLRYESPFRGHFRHVRRDTTLAGVTVPADSHLLLLWGAANRDPAHFDEPAAFRLDRHDTRGHLGFGKGAHFCIGATLARLEARIVLTALLERTTWIDAAETGPWLPSILVRRLAYLRLSVR